MITMWAFLLFTLLWSSGAKAQGQFIFDVDYPSGDMDDTLEQEVNDAFEAAQAKIDHALDVGTSMNTSTSNIDRGWAIFECAIEELLEALKATSTTDIPDVAMLSLQQKSHCVPTRPWPWCGNKCFHDKYRNIDGTCNNLDNRLWGSVLTPFNRLIEAFYENGFHLPRGWIKGFLYNGYPLPSPRWVSTEIVAASPVKDDKRYTHMLMQWGQFLDHDIDLTPINSIRSIYGEPLDTCENTCSVAQPCFPIHIPPNDPRVKDKDCFPFTRSSAICGTGVFPIKMEQLNEITAYIDASNVYGSTDEHNNLLRDSADPHLLRMGNAVPGHPDKSFLPFDDDGFSACAHDVNRPDTRCFLAGDARSNEQPGLTSMHTLWVREHNRIAKKLKIINWGWNSEKVFQEARKIVGAMAQKITYSDFLPLIIGPEGMYMLGKYTGYNQSVDASILNCFATAGYRFGHTMVQPIIQRLHNNLSTIPAGNLFLHEAFFAPYLLLEEGGIDPIINGLLDQPAKKIQPKRMMNTELTEKLFALSTDLAHDLASLNIQRGRDHGLPTYTQVREYCGLGVANTFDDLYKVITKKRVLRRLEYIYKAVANIDLFVGGISEKRVRGGRVGPVFLCILVEQFRRLRDGDRFFYANPGVFNSDQLAEIRKASLARVICDNSDAIDRVQPNVFRTAWKRNERVQCEEIPALNLDAWRDGACPGYPTNIGNHIDFDPWGQICCCTFVFNADPSIYKCCNDQLYDPRRDSCCEGELYCGKPEKIFSCCGKYIFNSASERCIDGFVCSARDTRTCGRTLYNSRTHICCEGRICLKTHRLTTCCGSMAYIPTKQICCERSVRKVLSKFTRCCREYSYEAHKEVCCPDTAPDFNPVHPRPRNLGDVVKYNSVTEKCSRNDNTTSGMIAFNYQTETCCCGTKLPWALPEGETCCGHEIYDVWTHLCCNGTVVEGDPKIHKCCGNYIYNPNTQSCCDTDCGPAVVDCVGGCPVPDTGDCSGIPYDLQTQLCCNGYINDRPSPSYQCCNGWPLNTDTHTCCLNCGTGGFEVSISFVNDNGYCTTH